MYIVDQREQVIVARLGEVVRELKAPGLYFKIPFIDITYFYDRRLLDYDSSPKEVITADKKTMVIDNYAKWKIENLGLFYQSMGSEYQALLRLDDIIYSTLRERLGNYKLDEIVSPKRASIMDEVARVANEKTLAQFGVRIVDVRIRRAELPQENEKSIFERMQAERQKQAKQYRAEGQKAATMIRAETDKQVQIILSQAKQASTSLRVTGEAQAMGIYAEAFSKDPEFYGFYRTMQAYENFFSTDDVMLFGSDSELFKYLKDLNAK
jgi:modulator of FtsH protease HflC